MMMYAKRGIEGINSYGNFYQLELSGIWVMLLELTGRLQVNRNNVY